MAAAQGTKKANEEDEMLAKAIALSLEDVEDKQVRRAIDLSKVENKPVPLFPGNQETSFLLFVVHSQSTHIVLAKYGSAHTLWICGLETS